MRLLLDQDIYAVTAAFLRAAGHDVLTAADAGAHAASDDALLRLAAGQQRILVTRDRDFGALVFLKGMGTGVVYLRFGPSDLEAGHLELGRVLSAYSFEELSRAFVVVETGRHRFRRIG